ncbi:MAG TPA: hypothetical protein VK034_11045 [Enhygromyxa sp.]|nr:hypothetical protein [Enhygromyxa sp.]
MARRLTVGAFGSTERKRKNGQRAEAEAADARPAKVDDRLEVDPEPAVLIVDAPAHPAAREHQRPRAIVVLVIVTAVTGIAATAGAVATAVVGTSATTGVAAGIADVVAREAEPAAAAVVARAADVVAADVEPAAAARATTDRPTTTLTTLTTKSG